MEGEATARSLPCPPLLVQRKSSPATAPLHREGPPCILSHPLLLLLTTLAKEIINHFQWKNCPCLFTSLVFGHLPAPSDMYIFSIKSSNLDKYICCPVFASTPAYAAPVHDILLKKNQLTSNIYQSSLLGNGSS